MIKFNTSLFSQYFSISTSEKQLLHVLFIAAILIATTACTKKNNLPDPLEAGWNHQPVCEVLQENEKLRVLRCAFPPGVGHEKHYHNAHVGYTIAGSRFSISDSTGTKEINVLTGSSFSNEGVDWHEVLNIGDSTAVFLIIEPK
jgi:quercetin dioxygenase-like cupin family protein